MYLYVFQYTAVPFESSRGNQSSSIAAPIFWISCTSSSTSKHDNVRSFIVVHHEHTHSNIQTHRDVLHLTFYAYDAGCNFSVNRIYRARIPTIASHDTLVCHSTHTHTQTRIHVQWLITSTNSISVQLVAVCSSRLSRQMNYQYFPHKFQWLFTQLCADLIESLANSLSSRSY